MSYASVHIHKTNSLEDKSLLQHCQHNLLSYECESMFDSVQVTEIAVPWTPLHNTTVLNCIGHTRNYTQYTEL